MIHTIRAVAVGDQESKIDSPIILYRGDREVEVEFTINGSKFTFTNGGNVIKSTNATHGQLVINSHFESPFVPFSYHNNGSQNTNYINLDGCTFSGNESSYQYDIGFGYYKNNTEPVYVTVKNCISDRGVAVYQETSSVESDNVFELVEINNILRK